MSTSTKALPTKVWPLFTALLLLVFLAAPAHSQDGDIDDETCLDCHEGRDTTLSHTPHQLASTLSQPTVNVRCTSCHSGADVHIDDPGIGNIGNPARALASETEATCTACHQPHMQMGMTGFDPHFSEDFSCTACHKVHSAGQSQLIDDEGGFCKPCHVSVVGEFRKRSNHPLTDQAVTCMSCHDFTSNNDITLGHGGNANCFQCHPEQSGPYLYEHEATSSFSTQGDACTACHRPHGSPNERLLVRTGDMLCLQCHGTPPNHRIKHDGLGTQYACEECHSETHGSYISRTFLDPQLGSKINGEPGSCFCHGIDD